MYDEMAYFDILGLNAESIWLGAMYAMQTMLSGFNEWELEKNCNGKDDIAADFARRVSFFHEKTLIPVTQYVKNSHIPPSFAVEALRNIPNNNVDGSTNRNQIFDLHARLLCEASKSLIHFKCSNGRSVTTEVEVEVKNWFAVLKHAAEAFAQFASADTLTELEKVLEAFDHDDNDTDDDDSSPDDKENKNTKEFAFFFCHKFLFIRIAYMVEFYTNATTSTNMTSQSKNKGYTFLTPSKDHKKRWGTFSGNLIQTLFQKELRGLPVLDREISREGYIEKCTEKGLFNFPMLNCLPYKEFFERTRKNRGKPSLHELQESILCEMFGNIRQKSFNEMGHQLRLGRRYSEQLERLKNIFSVAVSTTERNLQTLHNREKVRRCLKKKNKAKHQHSNQSISRSRRNRKQRGPDKFIWDVFIMGTDSYYHQFNDCNGVALREFYKKCNARGQLQHNYVSV